MGFCTQIPKYPKFLWKVCLIYNLYRNVLKIETVIDLILANSFKSPIAMDTTETDLSDFHKVVITFLRFYQVKQIQNHQVIRSGVTKRNLSSQIFT